MNETEKQGPSAEHKKALAKINSGAKSLAKARRSLMNLADQNSWTGRMRRFAVSKAPSFVKGRVNDWLVETPMGALQAHLRSSIIDMHSGIGTLLREGKETVNFNQELADLVGLVKDSPDDQEALGKLREKLVSRAEESLDLESDPETEKFLEEMRQKAQERNPGAATERLLANAEQVIAYSGPALRASEDLLVTSAGMMEDLLSTYSTVYSLRPLLDSMYRSSEDLARAERLGIVADVVIFDQIDLAINTAKFALEAAKIKQQIATSVTPRRLQILESRAQKLLNPPAGSHD